MKNDRRLTHLYREITEPEHSSHPFIRGFLRLTVIILAVLSMGSAAVFISAEESDRDHDGIITYKDLSQDTRIQLEYGYTAGLRNYNFGFEMIFNLSNRYVRNVGLPHLSSGNQRSSSSYTSQAWKTRSYYRHERYNYEKYPRFTNQWYGVRSWEDPELGWVAEVNCTAPTRELTTPETIYYDGHRCTVVGIKLTNAYLKKLTITDNILYITRCECPELREITGGLNVVTIGEEAFKDCIYLTNLPYFPHLTTILPFAFEGCYFLTEVLLPPNITWLATNAFGWYDVVKGNYDLIDDSTYDDDSLGPDMFADKYKIFGITLYAAPGTETWKTLQDIFENRSADDVLLDNISYAAKNKYPGRQPAVEIEEEEFLPWIPQDTRTDQNWMDTVIKNSDVNLGDDRIVSNALSDQKKEALDWIAGMIFSGEINDDMAVTLVCSMSGYADIPKAFLDKHLHSEHCLALISVYKQATNQALSMQKLKEAGKAAEAAALDAERAKNRNLALKYFCTTINTTADFLKKAGNVKLEVFDKALGYVSTINDLLTYVMDGSSWTAAISKTLTTTLYSAGIGMYAPSPVAIFETIMFVLFGNSKAGDAGSIVGTGKHYVEFMTDLYAVSFYDAWLNSNQFADRVKWRAFYSLFYQNVKTVLNDLTDTKNYKYGQNLTNCYYLLNTILMPENFIHTFNGIVEMFYSGEAYSVFSDTVYDVTVKDNLFGGILFDYIASFYEEAPDILTEYTKTFNINDRGKKRSY